jgi:hypothetical protein
MRTCPKIKRKMEFDDSAIPRKQQILELFSADGIHHLLATVDSCFKCWLIGVDEIVAHETNSLQHGPKPYCEALVQGSGALKKIKLDRSLLIRG